MNVWSDGQKIVHPPGRTTTKRRRRRKGRLWHDQLDQRRIHDLRLVFLQVDAYVTASRPLPERRQFSWKVFWRRTFLESTTWKKSSSTTTTRKVLRRRTFLELCSNIIWKDHFCKLIWRFYCSQLWNCLIFSLIFFCRQRIQPQSQQIIEPHLASVFKVVQLQVS